MPSAFNPWSDLTSYHIDVMRQKMAELDGETPVIIIENTYALWEEGGATALVNAGISEETVLGIQEDQKWKLLEEFMEENGYRETFRNEKYALYRAEEE
jgi:hypothetical protein